MKNLDLAKKTRISLEKLYTLYGGDVGGGELIMLDESDTFLYKGQAHHYDQTLILFHNHEITIKINGFSESEKLAHNSIIKINDTEDEIRFNDIYEGSEEYSFILRLNESIDDMLTSQNVKKLQNKHI